LTALTTYQVEPAVAAEQPVLQAEPGTVATTVTASVAPSVVTIAEVVEAPARMFTLLHAGTICWVPGGAATGGTGGVGLGEGVGAAGVGVGVAVGSVPGDQLDPLSEKMQAK
jgi:hypothetical protein